VGHKEEGGRNSIGRTTLTMEDEKVDATPWEIIGVLSYPACFSPPCSHPPIVLCARTRVLSCNISHDEHRVLEPPKAINSTR